MIHTTHGHHLAKLLGALYVTSMPVHAQSDWQLHIVNHFTQPLQFIITINPQVVPDLQHTFDLAVNTQCSTRVLATQTEAYLRTLDTADHSAFWGVEVLNNHLALHGYISKGIAYSWRADQLVFCTPEEYKQYHSCIHS